MAKFLIVCKLSMLIDWLVYWFKGSMSVEDAAFNLLMRTFRHSAIPHGWAIWDVFSLNAGKNCIVFVFLCSVLSCDSTCLAPCCECSHWAVITHLSAVWNIHSQVSPSLWVSHMDSLLSPPPLSPHVTLFHLPFAAPHSPLSFWLHIAQPPSLEPSAWNATVPLYCGVFFPVCWLSERVRRIFNLFIYL